MLYRRDMEPLYHGILISAPCRGMAGPHEQVSPVSYLKKRTAPLGIPTFSSFASAVTLVVRLRVDLIEDRQDAFFQYRNVPFGCYPDFIQIDCKVVVN
jgi:hypothetical protein